MLWVKKFNYIATSDFHEEKHLRSWKTLLRCRANSDAVKQAIRSNEAVSLLLCRGGTLKAIRSPDRKVERFSSYYDSPSEETSPS